MSPSAAVIFDIGNVLIEWQPERFYDRAVGEDRRRAMFAAVDLHAMNDRVDLDQGFRDITYATAEEYPEFRTEIRMWHDDWLALATPVIDRSVRLLRALRARGISVQALTNFGVASFALARARFDFLSEFDRTFVSGEMGIIKPDPAIYAAVEAALDLDGGAMLFTDDRDANVAAAAARGWRTHLFTNAKGWADRLVTEGLLMPEEAI